MGHLAHTMLRVPAPSEKVPSMHTGFWLIIERESWSMTHQTVLESLPSLRQRRLWLPRLKSKANEAHAKEPSGLSGPSGPRFFLSGDCAAPFSRSFGARQAVSLSRGIRASMGKDASALVLMFNLGWDHENYPEPSASLH